MFKKHLLLIYSLLFLGILLNPSVLFACNNKGGASEKPVPDSDEIDSKDGNFWEEITDFSINTGSIPIKFSRSYNANSNANMHRSLGTNWVHSYDMFIFGSTVHMGDGKQLAFTWDGFRSNELFHNYKAPKGTSHILVFDRTNLIFRLKMSSGMTYDFQKLVPFSAFFNLISITDKNGNKILVDHSDGDKVSNIKEVKNTGTTPITTTYLTFQYIGSLLESVTDNAGRQVKYIYDVENGDYYLTYVKYYNYNKPVDPDLNDHGEYTWEMPSYSGAPKPRIIKLKDPRLPKGFTELELTYDGLFDRVISSKASNGATLQTYIDIKYDDTIGIGTRTIKDAKGNAYTMVVNYFNESKLAYETDKKGIRTSYGYDTNGFTTTIVRTDTTGATLTTNYSTYNGMGDMLTSTNADGKTTTYTYTSSFSTNTVLTTEDFERVYYSFVNSVESSAPYGSGSTKVTTRSYYDTATGNLTCSEDAMGNKSYYAYNNNGQIITATDALTNITTYEYYPSGHAYKYLFKKVTKQITDTVSTWTEYIGYDSLNRNTIVRDVNGNDTINSYDINDRITRVDYSDGTNVRYEYDLNGNRKKVTDAKGNITQYTYDKADRLTDVKDANNGLTHYVYDENGNRRTLVDARGNATVYTYDVMDRLATVTDATGHKTTYSYDKLGNIDMLLDAKGQTTTYTYDVMNRLTSDGTISYIYDDVGNKKQMVQNTGTTLATSKYFYDKSGRVTKIIAPRPGNPKATNETTYTYDNIGNRKTMKIAGIGDGNTAEYDYFKTGWLKSVTDQCGRTTTYAYDNVGNRTSVTYPGSIVTTTYAYNTSNYRLLSIESKKDITTLMKLEYTYDAVGNRLTMVDSSTTPATTSYQYDNLYQLTHVSYPDLVTTDYTYDVVGNRTKMIESGITTNYQYNNANELEWLNKNGTQTNFGYDDNGNQTSKGNKTMSWNTKNQLIAVSTPGVNNVAYEYDGDGRRKKKSVTAGGNTTIQEYYYDGANCFAETDGNGALKAIYTHGAEMICKRDSSGDLFYIYDAMGNTMVTTDGNRVVVTRYSYDAFGKVRWQSQTDTRNQNKFVGGSGVIDDSEVGLMYMRARYYDSETGRFISRDPIGTVDDLNEYRYCQNNPVNYIDATGLCRMNAILKKVLARILLHETSGDEGGSAILYATMLNRLKDTTHGKWDQFKGDETLLRIMMGEGQYSPNSTLVKDPRYDENKSHPFSQSEWDKSQEVAGKLIDGTLAPADIKEGTYYYADWKTNKVQSQSDMPPGRVYVDTYQSKGRNYNISKNK